jgi:BirA family transcriptional regulator, biotin operon repressor / biotin---[acetyl-CoA-carboxylase] ligase
MNPPLLDPDVLQEGAGSGPIGRRVMVYRETASTNDLLLRLGESGEPAGLVVFAERQTSGRGRFQRPWHSADGLGLWFSVLLRPNLAPDRVTLLTPLVAVAVTEGLESVAPGASLRIKKPNDIYGAKGKVAGILIEARTGPKPFVVIGIGINISHQVEDFPEELRATASSLSIESGTVQDRSAAACSVLQHLNKRLPEIELGTLPFLERYEALSAWSPATSLQTPNL